MCLFFRQTRLHIPYITKGCYSFSPYFTRNLQFQSFHCHSPENGENSVDNYQNPCAINNMTDCLFFRQNMKYELPCPGALKSTRLLFLTEQRDVQ